MGQARGRCVLALLCWWMPAHVCHALFEGTELGGANDGMQCCIGGDVRRNMGKQAARGEQRMLLLMQGRT